MRVRFRIIALAIAVVFLGPQATTATADEGPKKGRVNDVNGWCYECPSLPPDVIFGPCPCQINEPIIIT